MSKSKQQSILKQSLKSALTELIEENEELVKRILGEVIEDAFMARAIKKGRRSKKVSRERIFKILSVDAR